MEEDKGKGMTWKKDYPEIKPGLTFVSAGKGNHVYAVEKLGRKYARLKYEHGNTKGQVQVFRSALPNYIKEVLT